MQNFLIIIATYVALGGLALTIYFVDQWVQKNRGVQPFNGEIPSGPIWKSAQVVGVIALLYVAANYGKDYEPLYHRR